MPAKSIMHTVQEILELAPRLGIPHFQRGLVWGNDSVAALLESLFFDVPCGSFVFWQPSDCSSLGVPLDESGSQGIQYLIIDGQQRIRSLCGAFLATHQTVDETDEIDSQDEDDPRRDKIWCINLAKIPIFVALLRPQKRDFSMFVFTADPKTRMADSPPHPFGFNVLPLQLVLDADSWGSPVFDPYRELIAFSGSPSAKEGHQQLAGLYKAFRDSIVAMKSREFFVSVQVKNDPAEMANLYNRINAGGKRVEIEERAFAKLVGAQPRTYDMLSELFATVHGDSHRYARSGGDDPKGSRDAVLQRQKERSFGFKLFIRIFLQVCQHHFGGPPRKSDFSFDLVGKDSFLKAYGELGPDNFAWLWRETSVVLNHVRSILSNELCCDDLRFLPDTTPLAPVFQLLIHYPGLRDPQYRSLLAGICLRLLLANLSTTDTFKLVARAGDSRRVAFDVVPEILKQAESRLRDHLATGLRDANSIQSRYVLLLYWLERHLGARDFRYSNVRPNAKLQVPERLVSEEIKPEKQHLVPFSRAGDIYTNNPRRNESHSFNNVGNLTYISQILNSFEYGLSDTFVDLEHEPIENLYAHLLKGEEQDQEIVRAYGQLRTALASTTSMSVSRLKGEFVRMIERRQEVFRAKLRGWLESLDQQTCRALGVSSIEDLGNLAQRSDRVEPVLPRFGDPNQLDLAHLIRQMGFDHGSEDRLIDLVHRARRTSRKANSSLYVDLQLSKNKWVWVTISVAEATLHLQRFITEETRRKIFDALAITYTSDNKVRLHPVPDFAHAMQVIADLNALIESEVSEGRNQRRAFNNNSGAGKR